MFVIKRDGKEVEFNREKIINAIKGANKDVLEKDRLTETEIENISIEIEHEASKSNHTFNVEEIQDMVEDSINTLKKFVLGRAYSQYRFKRALVRKANTTDDSILSLIDYTNEEIKQENSNKNPRILSVQRDYMAGEVSKDLTRRFLLPDDVLKAHDEGIIHFHDADYFAQHFHNCGLVNLEDMLNNGTVISGTLIERPHSFSTACNIMTQIMAQVASSQYGGQSMSLAHIAPFVDVSRKKIRERNKKAFDENNIKYTEEELNNITESNLKEEINKGVQMIQYQAITLQSTNGQAPFVTLFMYIDELPEGRTRDDLVMIIEEVLKQRYLGVKNEKGVRITPAFPKLIYVLDEDNIYPESKYYYLTELAAKCSAKRLVPDYISAKKMKELKDGEVYSCMGCVDYNSTVKVRFDIEEDPDMELSIGELWDILETDFNIKPLHQDGKNSANLYYDLRKENIQIYDTSMVAYVDLLGMVRNVSDKWLSLSFVSENGNKFNIECTIDHPFSIRSGDVVYAKDLSFEDEILTNDGSFAKLSDVIEIETEKFSYDVTTSSEHFEVNGLYSHNCRSFLSVEDNVRTEDGKRKFWGRFNQGVVTINLPDVALSSGGDFDKFWEIYEERLELCHKALRCRHERLLGTSSDCAPIIWQHGGYARLKKGEVIDKLLYGGYSTISLGYAGLYECVKYMTGKSHTDKEATDFALSVMQKLNDKTNEWKKAENIGYSVYGSPIESTTYKFAKCLQKRFGIIEGITDRGYITNSYHIFVGEKINAFDKLTFESPFQALSPGGAISYVETTNLDNHIEAVMTVLRHIYDNIIYAELNTKSDYCHVCGYDGEIQVIEDEEQKKLVWECPICKNRDQNKMNVARRTCGYIG